MIKGRVNLDQFDHIDQFDYINQFFHIIHDHIRHHSEKLLNVITMSQTIIADDNKIMIKPTNFFLN